MKALFGLILSLLFLFVLPQPLLAQEKINSFDVSIVAHKDGSMTVKESIDYDFGQESRHGIFRTIPLVSEVGDLYRVVGIDFLDVKRDGKGEKYQVDLKAKETEVKIGDPDKTITGQHNYIIIYKVKNGIASNYEDHDEIYWNVTGDGWKVPIEKASLKVETDFGISSDKFKCFTGIRGQTEENCQIAGNTITTNKLLGPSEGLTIVANFPVNTFPKSTLQKIPP